jgi:hypothetical protein
VVGKFYIANILTLCATGVVPFLLLVLITLLIFRQPIVLGPASVIFLFVFRNVTFIVICLIVKKYIHSR